MYALCLDTENEFWTDWPAHYICTEQCSPCTGLPRWAPHESESEADKPQEYSTQPASQQRWLAGQSVVLTPVLLPTPNAVLICVRPHLQSKRLLLGKAKGKTVRRRGKKKKRKWPYLPLVPQFHFAEYSLFGPYAFSVNLTLTPSHVLPPPLCRSFLT